MRATITLISCLSVLSANASAQGLGNIRQRQYRDDIRVIFHCPTAGGVYQAVEKMPRTLYVHNSDDSISRVVYDSNRYTTGSCAEFRDLPGVVFGNVTPAEAVEIYRWREGLDN